MQTMYQLRSQFDRQKSAINDVMLQHRSADKTKQWQDLYYSFPSPLQTLSYTKRVAAIENVDPVLHAALKEPVEALMKLATDIYILKQAEDKAKADRKAAREAKAKEKSIKKKNPYYGLNEKVASVLREIAEPYRVKAVELETKAQQSFIDNSMKKRAAEKGTLNPQVIYPIDFRNDNAFAQAIAADNRRQAHRYVHCPDATWTWLADLDKIVQKHAEEYAEALVNAFVQKIGKKLSGIIDRKAAKSANGALVEAKITGSLNNHWMTFTFADGSEFQVQTQIVLKVSVNGVRFNQHPACFRNVKLADGSKMELPSEAKMKESFV